MEPNALTNGKVRNSNIELFRIITMLLIVAHHYVVNSGLMPIVISDFPSKASTFLIFFGWAGKMGINCFVLITGYFMCTSQITLRKGLKLLLQVEFYKIILFFFFVATGYINISFKSILNGILPITSVSDGFVSCFLIFFCFIPFLNILIKGMNQKQHLILIGLCLTAFSIPSQFFFEVTFNYVGWFMVIYFIAAFFRLYAPKWSNSTKFTGFAALVLLVISLSCIWGWGQYCIMRGRNPAFFFFVADSNKPLAVATAVSAFLFFKNIKIGYSKIINTIAASAFGVLLIHANSNAMRQWLWKDTLNNVAQYPDIYTHAILSVLAIYAICSAIDFLRIQLFETPLFKIINPLLNRKKQRNNYILLQERNVMPNNPITVTSPLLPSLDDFIPMLKDIWDRKWLTNNGHYHQELEKALADYLGVDYISLFTNGTLPLITALQAMKITGEVITTPYSFVATTHSIWWNGLKPVFVDVDEDTGNIDPEKIEAAITPHTTAIMPVHVYGTPCNTKRIQEIADIYGLKVIYDAAHAFGVMKDGESVLKAGDMSTLSFHATKVYNTIEGGALVCHDAATKRRIDFLKNFGFNGETTVVAPGINSKMDEIRSAYGLLNLKQVDNAIAKRKVTTEKYREALKDIPGVRYLKDIEGVRHNYAYFPIFINEKEYGMSRDSLYAKLQDHNIFGRRYFYPLISTFSAYKGLESANPKNLPVAHKLANQVLCLPMFAGLDKDSADRVIDVVRNKK